MKKIFLVAVAMVALLACGGGGGSDDPKISNVEGTWRGNLTLAADLCGLNVNPLQEHHEIIIDGDKVTLISTDGRTLEGNAITDSSFVVQVSDGEAFPMIDSVQYDSITNGTANVTVEHVWSRPGGCNTKWVGVMNRD